MTGRAELVSLRAGVPESGLGPVSGWFLRPGIDLTYLTLRWSGPVCGGLTRQVRNLTRHQRPNLPRDAGRWSW